MEPAPLLVPLVEEGWLEGEVPRLAVRKYLEPLVQKDIDALVLGCTHYPLLAPVITRELAALSGRDLPVIDSAHAVATELRQLLDDKQLHTERDDAGKLRVYVTDMPKQFGDVASRFLGREVESLNVTQVDL
jgi:glutamate racemase